MPVTKHRSVADMPPPRPLGRLSVDGLRVACELSELAYKMRPWRLEPGVRRFASVAEADRHRLSWEKAAAIRGR